MCRVAGCEGLDISLSDDGRVLSVGRVIDGLVIAELLEGDD